MATVHGLQVELNAKVSTQSTSFLNVRDNTTKGEKGRQEKELEAITRKGKGSMDEADDLGQ